MLEIFAKDQRPEACRQAGCPNYLIREGTISRRINPAIKRVGLVCGTRVCAMTEYGYEPEDLVELGDRLVLTCDSGGEQVELLEQLDD